MTKDKNLHKHGDEEHSHNGGDHRHTHNGDVENAYEPKPKKAGK